jgi:hypothetical protein
MQSTSTTGLTVTMSTVKTAANEAKTTAEK